MGMPKIEVRLQMFRGDWDQIWSQERLLWMMEGLCRVNQTHLRQMDAFRKKGLIERGYPPLYRSGLHYETEKGTEIWPDIPSLLSGTMGKGVYPGPWGDCLPVSTLILRDDYTVAPIGALKPGDRIISDGKPTTVLEHCITGEKDILNFELGNGCHFRCSPNHRVFLDDGQEVRAEEVRVGQRLFTPQVEFDAFSPIKNSKLSDTDYAWLLGVYVADGWAEFGRHKRFSISGKDGFKKEEQKRRVQELMQKAGVHTRWHERYIAVSDPDLAEEFSKLGDRAPQKHLPSLCFSKEQVRSVLEGLQADCSVATNGTLTHGTTSEILALQLRILYRMIGQSVHIRRWDDHGGLGTNPMYRVTVRRPSDETGRTSHAKVVSIREDEPELCADITTESGRFYLPESDLIVHNCEDLACYRVAELRELPWHFERPAPWDSTKTEALDPRFPQGEKERAAQKAGQLWPGWKKVDGGIRAKPYAKWRRGPKGNYHYHALVLLPDGRIEDPSLVLGMGREKAFYEAGTAEKMKNTDMPIDIQFAKKPDVMVVDPEKPSGYAGGKAPAIDKKILALLDKNKADDISSGEEAAYMSNEIPLGDGEVDIDQMIGWSRAEARFSPKNTEQETRRLLGYSND